MQLSETLRQFFQERGFSPQVVGDPPALSMRFQGQDLAWSCVAQPVVEQGCIVFFSVFPEEIPSERQLAMSELLTGINYGLLVGNFEMSFTTGDLRIRTSLDIGNGQIDAERLTRMVQINLAMMKTYFPVLQAVLQGELSPQDAIAAM
jgi:hypothetical protein